MLLQQLVSWGLTWFVAGFGFTAGVAALVGLVQGWFYVWEQFASGETPEPPCRFCLQEETERRPIIVAMSGREPQRGD